MYLTAKLVYKSGFMFTIRISEIDVEVFLLHLFREYLAAIKDYNILDDKLKYVEIENFGIR